MAEQDVFPSVSVLILCQEEPVFLGPFLQAVIRQCPQRIQAVFIAGSRSAGESSKTWRDRMKALYGFWLLMEPLGFGWALLKRLEARVLGARASTSVAKTAKKYGIAVYRSGDPNGPETLARLRALSPEVILNQSEWRLGAELLAIPTLGVLNRHASLLPAFRGRLASFWAHAHQPPQYGVTFHWVDEGIDTGPVVLQSDLSPQIDPRWAYPQVMKTLCKLAVPLFWQTIDLLPDFQPEPQPNNEVSLEAAKKFPSLTVLKAYRQELARRRKQHEYRHALAGHFPKDQ
ncbi:MAG: formyltransferase family protein [Candidatus Melainabacteria bacterium]|nr:formyltransferase family protein [Candidatus Melainabacteria bacterium]